MPSNFSMMGKLDTSSMLAAGSAAEFKRVKTPKSFDATSIALDANVADRIKLRPDAISAAELVNATTNDVRNQLPPFVNVVENNVTVAERLELSPAQNAHQYSQAGLQDLVTRLMALNPDGEAFLGVNLTDLDVSGYQNKSGQNPQVNFAAMISGGGPGQLSAFVAVDNIPPPAPVAGAPARVSDQAHYFYRTVSTVDSQVLILRQVERRIVEYKELLDEAKKLQAQIEKFQSQSKTRLDEIQSGLSRSRLHLSVAQQLKAEEVKRIAAVNERRRSILDRIDVVLYHKPRTANRFVPMPVTSVSSVSVDGKLQIPLRNLESVPQDLLDMVHHFRDAPVSWFPALDHVPHYFDKPAMLWTAFEHVRMRAAHYAALPYIPVQFGAGLAGAARRTMSLHAQQALAWRRYGLLLDTQVIDMEGMASAHRQLRQAATLADMIDGGHGSAKASKLSAIQLDEISQAAGSLYASFADVPAEKRLLWAENWMDDGGQASFRDLQILPGWMSLETDLRREQQGLVDLLYQHVHAENPEAVTAINRLVIVALLVAAHAPVAQLINAKLVRPVPALPGVTFDLSLDVTQARVGMAVAVHNRPGEIAARAVIDDIVGGRVRARVIEALQPNITLSMDAIVHLSESSAFKASLSPNKKWLLR